MRIKPNFKYYKFLEESHFEEVISMIDLIDQEKFISSISEENIIDINDTQEIFSDLSSKVQILKNEFLLEKTFTRNAKQFNNQEDLMKGFRNKLASRLPESIILDIKENVKRGRAQTITRLRKAGLSSYFKGIKRSEFSGAF